MGTSVLKAIESIESADLRGIGLVSVSWSFLEGAAERIIWRLGRLDDRKGASITTHMSLGMRLDAALSLLSDEFPGSDEAVDLKKLATHIRGSLASNRNRIVHSRVVLGNQRLIYKARGTLKKEVETVEPGEYEEIHLDIVAATDQLREILFRVIDLVAQADNE